MSRKTFVSKPTVISLVVTGVLAITALYLLISSILLLGNTVSENISGTTPLATTSPSASQSKSSEYILPDSDKRYYSYDELNALSDEQLNFAHNEIYARHGRMFKDKRYADHFAACSWYEPRYSPEEYDAMPNQLNQFEKANSDLMAQIRAERGIK